MILSLGNQRISLKPAEKTLKKHQEPTGKHHKSTQQVRNIPNQMSPDFSPISDCFLWERAGSWPEIMRKNFEKSSLKYCFHVPLISGVFLPEPVHAS